MFWIIQMIESRICLLDESFDKLVDLPRAVLLNVQQTILDVPANGSLSTRNHIEVNL